MSKNYQIYILNAFINIILKKTQETPDTEVKQDIPQINQASQFYMPMQFDPNQMQQNFAYPFNMMGNMISGMSNMPQMMPMMAPMSQTSQSVDDKGAQIPQMYYQYMPMSMIPGMSGVPGMPGIPGMSGMPGIPGMPTQTDEKDKQQFVFVQPVYMYPQSMGQTSGEMNNQPYFSPMMPQFMPMYMGGQPDLSKQNEGKKE